MGGKSSKTDQEGTVNNNVNVQTHIELLTDSRTLLGVLILLKIIELLYVMIKDYRRGVKKMLSATINPIVHNSFVAEADPKKYNDQNAY